MKIKVALAITIVVASFFLFQTFAPFEQKVLGPAVWVETLPANKESIRAKPNEWLDAAALVYLSMSSETREQTRDQIDAFLESEESKKLPFALGLDPVTRADLQRVYLPALTSARYARRSHWLSASGTFVVHAEASCPDGRQCVFPFAKTQDVNRTRSRSEMLTAWPVFFSLCFDDVEAHEIDMVANRALEPKSKIGSLLVRDRLRFSLNDKDLKDLKPRALRSLRKKKDWYDALSTFDPLTMKHRDWFLATGAELCVVPKLSSLATYDAFSAEVESMIAGRKRTEK